MTITDANGKVVRRMEEPASAGIHRVTWDLREQSPTAARAAVGAARAAAADGGGGGGRGGAGAWREPAAGGRR